MSDEVKIQRGFSDELRSSAAKLYDAAFGAKLSIAMPNPISRIAVLTEGFDPRFSFVAIKGNELVGIAGFKVAQGSFTGGISFRVLKKNLGFLNAIRAVLVLTLFERKHIADQLLMDGIGVSTNMRSSGIGTRLLNSLTEYAHKEGYQSVRLDVIDTNPAAQRLYERVGFVPVKIEHFAYLKWLLGFGSATQMEYRIF
ncbi:MAG: GNAT family N-acetyltransferase [Anaerolineaceae bacterium]|nr:GNAT family N-acetyltransferase [Anaerolineaceae bacterium]